MITRPINKEHTEWSKSIKDDFPYNATISMKYTETYYKTTYINQVMCIIMFPSSVHKQTSHGLWHKPLYPKTDNQTIR